MSYRFKQNYYIKEICECGETLRIKDHGSWVGYYCPKCKAGGSVQKHSKKRFAQNTSSGLPKVESDKCPFIIYDEFDEPMNLYEYCHKESGGLEGQALKNYINRYYGHD